MDILERVDKYWYESALARGLRAPVVASESDLEAFEQNNGVRLPADLRKYFLELNGTDGDGDAQIFRFWPLGEIRRVDRKDFALLDADSYFLFADYLMESWYYAIYLGNDPFFQNRVILTGFPRNPVVAQTFSEFLELYLRDEPKLYGQLSQMSPTA